MWAGGAAVELRPAPHWPRASPCSRLRGPAFAALFPIPRAPSTSRPALLTWPTPPCRTPCPTCRSGSRCMRASRPAAPRPAKRRRRRCAAASCCRAAWPCGATPPLSRAATRASPRSRRRSGERCGVWERRGGCCRAGGFGGWTALGPGPDAPFRPHLPGLSSTRPALLASHRMLPPHNTTPPAAMPLILATPSRRARSWPRCSASLTRPRALRPAATAR